MQNAVPPGGGGTANTNAIGKFAEKSITQKSGPTGHSPEDPGFGVLVYDRRRRAAPPMPAMASKLIAPGVGTRFFSTYSIAAS